MNTDAKVIYKDTLRAIERVDQRTDRATMYALRSTGRKARTAARRAAPVYRGSDPRAVPGTLRKSISTSRNVARSGRTFTIRVGPSGYPAHLYAAKVNEQTPYMQPAYDAALAVFAEEYAKAMDRMIARAAKA